MQYDKRLLPCPTCCSVSIPQAVWIACNGKPLLGFPQPTSFNTASGMDCMQSLQRNINHGGELVSIPQAVWIACNLSFVSLAIGAGVAGFQYRKRYGLHAIAPHAGARIETNRFNTASGMDCMQYCLPEPLKTVNPKGGFLVRPPFSRFSPNLREFFCRKKRFKRGVKPATSRKLLSTRKTRSL